MKAIITSLQMEQVKNMFIAMNREFKRNGFSAVLISYNHPQSMAIQYTGDVGAISGVLVATLAKVLNDCNQEQRDIAKGLILKEIFNQ
jgi:hypothetical protein